MRVLNILNIAMISAFIITGGTMTEGKVVESHPQTVCPVMGGKINRDVYLDHDGKRIYFCCAGCTVRFKQNPQKYFKILESGHTDIREHSCQDMKSADGQRKTGCSCGGCQSKHKNNNQKTPKAPQS